MTIGFLEEQYIANEGDGTVNLRVGIIRGEVTKDIVVRFSTEDGTAMGKISVRSSIFKVSNLLF